MIDSTMIESLDIGTPKIESVSNGILWDRLSVIH